MGVATTPGATAFTPMPCFAYSIARLRVTASWRSSGTTQFIPAIGWPAMVVVILMSGVCLRIELVRADSALIPTLGLFRLILRRASSWRSVPRAIARPVRKGRRRGHFTV
jgi:hypothetical protein